MVIRKAKQDSYDKSLSVLFMTQEKSQVMKNTFKQLMNDSDWRQLKLVMLKLWVNNSQSWAVG